VGRKLHRPVYRTASVGYKLIFIGGDWSGGINECLLNRPNEIQCAAQEFSMDFNSPKYTEDGTLRYGAYQFFRKKKRANVVVVEEERGSCGWCRYCTNIIVFHIMLR